MNIHVFEVPYDSGEIDVRMGRGPAALLEAGLVKHLRSLGHTLHEERVLSVDPYPAEIRSTFTLANQIAARVRDAKEQRSVSLVLSGNCDAALGTICGLGAGRTGVLWFDAHAEFNTPETTCSGFLDGMGLAIATGYCWKRMSESIAGFTPVPPHNIALIGVREIETEERDLLDASRIYQASSGDIREKGVSPLMTDVLASLKENVDSLYIHFDLDVLDPSVAKWNQWVPENGLTLTHIKEVLALVSGGPPISGIGIASHDPAIDPQRSAEAAHQIVVATLEAAHE